MGGMFLSIFHTACACLAQVGPEPMLLESIQ